MGLFHFFVAILIVTNTLLQVQYYDLFVWTLDTVDSLLYSE